MIPVSNCTGEFLFNDKYSRENKRNKVIIITGSCLDKYAPISRYSVQDFSKALGALGAAADKTECNLYSSLMNASLARSTWAKYSSALNVFSCFEAHKRKVSTWPLSLPVCRAFVIWCFGVRKLAPSSIKSYLSAIKFIHNLRGFPSEHITTDFFLAQLLKGANHISMGIPSKNTRRVVTFPLLLSLSTRIANTDWDPVTRQVYWAAATTAFFGSLRLGEILATQESNHSPLSDLTWEDVRASSDTSILIRLKQPKSGEKVEYVDLFRFEGYNCCPVLAFKNLREKQIAAGTYDPSFPVFRFQNGKNLTMRQFNSTLKFLLSDICVAGESSITCHSFRAGIPSTLSLFPDLATQDLIKGWGRWASDCYQRYTRLKLPQKMNIFSKISGALRSVQPLRGL